MTSVFATPKYLAAAYPYHFNGTLLVRNIAGGIPTDSNVAEAWLRSKMGDTKDELIQQMVAEVMTERNGAISEDEALAIINKRKHLNGFKRDAERDGELYVDGRYLKSCLKEAASVARAVDKLAERWGSTRKGIHGFVAEHIFITDERLYLGCTAPTDVVQSFIPNKRTGTTGIQYEECVQEAKIDFSLIADYQFKEQEWAMLWLTAQNQGIGAKRSQGYGRFELVRWEKTKK